MKTIISLLLLANILFSGIGVSPDNAKAGVKPGDSIVLPVIMYHRILKHSTNDVYTITPGAFERDLIYLRDSGYTTIGTEELLDYVERGKSLPEKPIMLTFDDGYYNNIFYAAPLLAEYNMKAAVFVVGQFSEKSTKENAVNPSYSYILWEHMENMPSCFEIQNHTWDMHNQGARIGIRRKKGESQEAYERAFADDLKKLNDKIEHHTGKRPVAFAIPFGAEERWAYDVLGTQGLKMCFCSEAGMSVVSRGSPETLHRLKRLLRTPGKSVEMLLNKYA
jgi:peptidoglycan/xylan/chitin deacetylase (PgdA/CDA1 family)